MTNWYPVDKVRYVREQEGERMGYLGDMMIGSGG